MKVVTYQGVVQNGCVQLPTGVLLPEKAKVYVVVPESGVEPVGYIASPRLVHPEQVKDFVKDISEESGDGNL